MKKQSLKWAMLVLSLPALAAASPDSDLDIYIGTLSVEGGKLMLARCDLASNRYLLRDEEAGKTVAALLPRLAAMKAPVYAEVIATYVQEKESNILLVDSVQNLRGGKTCHLTDVLPR